MRLRGVCESQKVESESTMRVRGGHGSGQVGFWGFFIFDPYPSGMENWYLRPRLNGQYPPCFNICGVGRIIWVRQVIAGSSSSLSCVSLSSSRLSSPFFLVLLIFNFLIFYDSFSTASLLLLLLLSLFLSTALSRASVDSTHEYVDST